MKEILEIINKEMSGLGVEYYYLYNTAETVKYPYVTGEYTELGYTAEDGSNSGDLLFEIWNRDTIEPIVQVLEKIKDHFRDYRATTTSKTVHISYVNAAPLRTGDENLNKYEVHLDVNYWEGERDA